MTNDYTMQRCPYCGYQFAVLAHEVGMHNCPQCGNTGHDDDAADPNGASDVESFGNHDGEQEGE